MQALLSLPSSVLLVWIWVSATLCWLLIACVLRDPLRSWILTDLLNELGTEGLAAWYSLEQMLTPPRKMEELRA